jgi:flagellar basal body-associated protein FliL
MAENNSSDDIVSLEALVKNETSDQRSATIAGAPVPQSAAPGEHPSEGGPADVGGAAAALAKAEPSIEQIEHALSVLDPGFSESLKEIHPNPDASKPEIEPIDLEPLVAKERAFAQAKGLKKILMIAILVPVNRVSGFSSGVMVLIERARTSGVGLAKEFALAALEGAKHGAKAALEGLKSPIKILLGLPKRSKLLLVVALGLAAALTAIVRVTFKGFDQVLPSMEIDYLRSFADVADAKFTYDRKEPMEDLNNPLLHPEHVVAIEKVIANLRPGQDESGEPTNPMAMIEVYVDTTTKESAIEIKDREPEVRDVISRTIEQMPYNEVITFDGKNKLKNFIRKNLNELLTKGRIRRVYFKTLVLKP